MEILERGCPPAERSAEFRCKLCHSALRATMDEGQYECDRLGGDFVVFTCPVCSRRIRVPAREFKTRE